MAANHGGRFDPSPPQECVIYDKPAPTLAEVVRGRAPLETDRKIQALYVDYVQRIKHGNLKQPRHERIRPKPEGLKELARELDIPVIALAQVNRAVEERTNKRPNMGDLSDSSAPKRKADQIMMFYRDGGSKRRQPLEGDGRADSRKEPGTAESGRW